jgi:hypothetical protein
MRLLLFSVILCLLVPLDASAQTRQRPVYSWYDDEGIKQYGDSIPPEFADKPKDVLNDQGVVVDEIEGRKTEEQLAAEAAAKALAVNKELQFRADQALLNTYISVAEIEMHRDRRVELFQAQARVTELYLRNLQRRLNELKTEAGRYKPYSSDPAANPIDPSLVEDIDETENSIERHNVNLTKFRDEEQRIKDRFQGDIERFKTIKGISADEPQTRAQPEALAQAVPE